MVLKVFLYLFLGKVHRTVWLFQEKYFGKFERGFNIQVERIFWCGKIGTASGRTFDRYSDCRHRHGVFLSVMADLESFYKKIGDKLKTDYSNSNAWFITSSIEALKFVGLRPSRKIKLFNGKLESRLAKYEIYSGSKKAKKNIN